MAKALKTTLQEYLSKPINKLETRKTVDEILSQMKENQTKHEKTTFATASTFNLETLQHLPDELRSGVCAKLGIVPTSNILKTNDYSTRKQLAAIISKYDPKEELSPSIKPMQV